MSRRIGSVLLAIVTTVLVMLSLIVNWAYTEVFTTSRFVKTASVAAQQPQVQSEIAEAMITPIAEERNLPVVFQLILQSAAERIVASPAFQTFWSDAIRGIHQPLVQELRSDASTAATSHRVDLRPMVTQLVSDIREENPRLGLLLADEYPQAEFELLSAEDLESARSTVSTITLIRTLLPIAALVFLVLSYFTAPSSVRTVRRPALLLAVGSGLALFVSLLVSPIASGLSSDSNTEISQAIASSIATSLRTQSLIVMLVGISVVGGATLLQRRQQSPTP
ncbi:MAG: hypothetical protein LW686_04265 [Ilumatobacteraceae bacterium]|jgi:hypothetical protein|nr:hypothetical protein [Ilumatobacteraceae bacterium]